MSGERPPAFEEAGAGMSLGQAPASNGATERA